MIVSLFGTHVVAKGEKAGEIVPGFRPYRAECSWSEFVEMLRAASEIETDRCNKVSTYSISMAEFEPDKNRGNNFALGADWIGIDIDNKEGLVPDPWTFDSLAAWLDEQGVTHVIYTTSSSREGRECMRLLMPLSERVGPLEWTGFWLGCNEWLRGKMDPQTKDIARLLFEPRKWSGADNRFIASPERQPLDVDAMFALVPPAPTVVATAPVDLASARARMADQVRIEGDLACLETSPIIPTGAVDKALTAPKGGRLFKFLCACSARAIRKGIAVTAWDMERLAANMDAALGGHRKSDLRREATRAMEWAQGQVLDDDAAAIAALRKTMSARYV
ncbi:hypothetical protein HH800_15745 [Sphingobium yanoikuyae]|uniref:Uncharacterized protein n=1 Tax=Sphingobium yanoikuyae TaxID=13690 RepID=A0A6M4GB30_SPHYA|nr:hypothetical protein [Sphingobium yanoikuyae]QJR03503.1 hypothetical protein HH800_15745 [Sphingobium yanoikuyae]